MKYALLLVLLSGCVASQKAVVQEPERPISCNPVPQWTSQDPTGKPIGIYVCFGNQKHLLYDVRLLPPPAPVAQAKPTPAKPPKRHRQAKPQPVQDQ